MRFIKFGSKSVKVESVEAVTIYVNEVTIHTERNRYTTYYQDIKTAKEDYARIIQELEGEENA